MVRIAKHDTFGIDAVGVRRVVRAGTPIPSGIVLLAADEERVPSPPSPTADAPRGTGATDQTGQAGGSPEVSLREAQREVGKGQARRRRSGGKG